MQSLKDPLAVLYLRVVQRELRDSHVPWFKPFQAFEPLAGADVRVRRILGKEPWMQGGEKKHGRVALYDLLIDIQRLQKLPSFLAFCPEWH